MHIHFICAGNFYRSRLAEAYLKSKKIPGLEVSSSGIQSNENYQFNGPISWYAMRLLKNYQLIPFMKDLPTQTTQGILDSADLVIFLSPKYLEFAQKNFGFKGNFEMWHISDLYDFNDDEIWRDPERLIRTEKTFQEIKEKVDELVAKLKL